MYIFSSLTEEHLGKFFTVDKKVSAPFFKGPKAQTNLLSFFPLVQYSNQSQQTNINADSSRDEDPVGFVVFLACRRIRYFFHRIRILPVYKKIFFEYLNKDIYICFSFRIKVSSVAGSDFVFLS